MKERNEKPKAYLATLISIIVPALNFFNLIPQPVKTNIFFKIFVSTIIVLAAVLMYRMIRKLVTLKLPATKFLWHSLSILFFGTCILIVCLQTSSKIIPTDTVQYQKTSKNGNNIIIQADTLSGNQIINGDNNSVQVNGNNNHVIKGDNNKVNVNGDQYNFYKVNKPSPRILSKKELNWIVSAIPSNDIRIRINYPSDNSEALNFGDQIFNALSAMGYGHLSKSYYSSSSGFSGDGRITIRKDTVPFPVLNLIVNPQP